MVLKKQILENLLHFSLFCNIVCFSTIASICPEETFKVILFYEMEYYSYFVDKIGKYYGRNVESISKPL